MLYPKIQTFCENLVAHFDEISAERKLILHQLSTYITEQIKKGNKVQLIYICTHNSRRSHFGQIWAAVASEFFEIEHVSSFSGGTEATAFNINAINALKNLDFIIKATTESSNPIYKVSFGDELSTLCFSKVFDDVANPTSNFAAIMTCSDAEENCPFIPGADFRIATTYADPKTFDNTALQEEKYSERNRQIALETLYVFGLVREMLK
jgi:protein-tyrosine phosphatase/arsenate reductase